MLKNDKFFVQFVADEVMFEETFMLPYRTEEWRRYWMDDELLRSHCHYRQAQAEAAALLGLKHCEVEIVTMFKTW